MKSRQDVVFVVIALLCMGVAILVVNACVSVGTHIECEYDDELPRLVCEEVPNTPDNPGQS